MTRGILVAVGVGGGLGALARFALSGWTAVRAGEGYPWGTFVVNVSGSILLGLLVGFLSSRHAPAPVRALLTVGFCGGFTTFSAYDLEVVALIARGEILLALVYPATTLVLCVVGLGLGLRLASARA